ncbi:saccharopine dehydrogenase family protein [Bradyrhizobium sp. TZ2]
MHRCRMPERNRREFDVVAYGATGFTGRLVCDYLQTCYGKSVKWAMAGRDLAKLARIRDDLGLTAPVIRADARDVKSMRALADRAQVLISTVGPYQLHGSTAVAACAALGTDYVDMTGEPVWMRDMMDAHSDAARASGARIIFSCGFDSIPFDLSVHELQKRYIFRWKRPAPRIRCRVRGLEGGISGGRWRRAERRRRLSKRARKSRRCLGIRFSSRLAGAARRSRKWQWLASMRKSAAGSPPSTWLSLIPSTSIARTFSRLPLWSELSLR